ncbi:sortilin-related receptor-like [Rhynchophorus ferrugineus]|uniref:sortilin-related receptor-like n=1 Tax=Rhynchophorus ferrugineus TaxID=354439 RepID=UPI003FCDB3B0
MRRKNFIFIFLIYVLYFVVETNGKVKSHIRTLYSNPEPPPYTIYNLDGNDDNEQGSNVERRFKRDLIPDTVDPSTKINHLNDTHKQLMVHWVGEDSNVVICLARDPSLGYYEQLVSPSAVYISYDDGDTYKNQTEMFKLPNGSYATLEKFYNHPVYNSIFVFTDVRHNLLYVTTNHGKNFTRIQLNFTPSELSFLELSRSTFVILDKNDTQNRLWITENLGKTFRPAHEFVKAFFWLKDGDKHQLLVQRAEPTQSSTILYSSDLFRERKSSIYATNVQDFSLKNDYLFTSKKNSKDGLDLYVSYKLGPQIPCVFNTTLAMQNFFIADVTGNRALVAASHSETSSNLYVSDNLNGVSGEVMFTLSLNDILAFFPNSTWQGTWLHQISDEAFVDLYKVEGLSGIYIASRVVNKPDSSIIAPRHLGSVITFDHGATWRLIQPPAVDVEGQTTSCLPAKECSLHLNQKFSQHYPETRSVTILSSKSAPGVIIATGVLGSNLKGHYGIYISVDAGLTWRQILRDLYFFNMGDHGGIVTAVKFFKSSQSTRHIKYSLDEGETWKQTIFHSEDIKLYGLMTQPGENTTVFTMFGSLPEEHRWIIVKVNFSNVFKSTCKPDDYKTWSPSQSEENRSYIPCILGEQTVYQKRLRHANCLNGLDFVRVVSKKPCDCDVLDFECDFGFNKVTDKVPRCVQDKSMGSYDPYKRPEACPPGSYYKRTKGYRKIEGDKCVQGFEQHYLPDFVPCPFKEIDEFLLFAQRENISRYNLVTGVMETLPISGVKNVIAIDFDIENNCVYWADINVDTINRQCFDNGSVAETLVTNDLASIEGMAYDWISKTLYFVDGVRAKIELIRTDISHRGRMRKTILDGTVLKKPRGIAVHPRAGYMFWTDWSVEAPSVNRANLDGSNSSTLFGKDRVGWPNGITVDYIANRIYWVDARQDYIGSSDLHGDGFQRIVHNVDVVSHPFAVAVFKSVMYWDDWKKNAIYSSDKDVYKGVQVVLKDLAGLMDLKVYAHGIQFGTNACSRANCSHICVGMPKNNYRCLCPDGMTANGTDCLCPGGVTALPNGTCPSVGNSCSAEHFSCGNGLCLPKGWRCDGENDCGDGSDEARCGTFQCPPSFHVCGDGKCLPHYWKCDYDVDCADRSDEVNCPKQNCTASQFSCDNGRCISKQWRCDGENDCRDNSDERNCDPDQPTTCKSEEEFQCKSGSVTCIPSTWKCDGESDCRDGSDEFNCSNNTCTESQFPCGPPNNRCIFKTWICDGDQDCPDGRDELNCPKTTTAPPKSTNDDFYVKNGTCQEWMFRCQNNRCIPFWWKCDMVDDCGDESDELGCSETSSAKVKPTPTTVPPKPLICNDNQFQCETGECISSAWVCDTSYDCPSGEDEQNCNSTKVACNEFKCRIDGSCILNTQVCDTVFDCPDKTDELSCDKDYVPNEPATPSCSLGYFPCDGGSCYPLSVMCDGKVDCHDSYDEQDCSNRKRVYQVFKITMDLKKSTSTSLAVTWNLIQTEKELEFMPSISKVSEKTWKNQSWVRDSEYIFEKLQPFTSYNITIFVREVSSKVVFPPAYYYVVTTFEGVPSPPLNVTAIQQNGSHILISWDKPAYPNGVITKYEILWNIGDSERTSLILNGDETSHLLTADFEHNKSYTFSIVAYNSMNPSDQSAPATIIFDGKTSVDPIKDLFVSNYTNTSVTLAWTYTGETDRFNINITADPQYPKLPPYSTKSTNCTLKLAPGANYTFEVYAIRNGLHGPHSQIQATTLGTPLPVVKITDSRTVKDVGTTVKLSWQRPEKYGKVSWTFGVYYGITQESLFEAVRYRTTNLTATIPNLHACETYMFAVGVVSPYGYGPLSGLFELVTTSSNAKAPPKDVQVRPEEQDPLRMFISWKPSCDLSDNSSYTLSVSESTTKRSWNIKVDNKLNHTLRVENGGIYSIRISTDISGAIFSKPVTYKAPPIAPPLAFSVSPLSNGSFIVFWDDTNVKVSGPYKFEILVHDGPALKESSAARILVDHSPLIYTNQTSHEYTFAVRIKTDKGFSSVMSQALNKISVKQAEADGSNLAAIIVPSLVVILLLIAVIGYLVVRNRRLQSSFVRFTNSHYSSRSGAATFDDNGLEEEECPRIAGFSDDEPLVI